MHKLHGPARRPTTRRPRTCHQGRHRVHGAVGVGRGQPNVADVHVAWHLELALDGVVLSAGGVGGDEAGVPAWDGGARGGARVGTRGRVSSVRCTQPLCSCPPVVHHSPVACPRLLAIFTGHVPALQRAGAGASRGARPQLIVSRALRLEPPAPPVPVPGPALLQPTLPPSPTRVHPCGVVVADLFAGVGLRDAHVCLHTRGGRACVAGGAACVPARRQRSGKGGWVGHCWASGQHQCCAGAAPRPPPVSDRHHAGPPVPRPLPSCAYPPYLNW